MLRGVVKDAGTGNPLAVARVRLIEVHREAQTHEDGQFAFGQIPAGRYQLVVQRIGYASQTVAVSASPADTLIVVAMRPSPLQLAATVVTGTTHERAAADATVPTTVLSAAALDRALSATVASTLSGQPGVAVTSMGPATSRPVLRGLSGDRVLVLEDGTRPGDLSSTSSDHAVAVDPVTARQMEVVRGPMSLLYGSSALGGVVNVIREEVPVSRPDGVHGTFSAQAASAAAGGTLGAQISAPLGSFAVRADGSARSTGDLRTPAGTLVNTKARTLGAGLGAAIAGPWGHFGAAARGYSNEYGLPGGFVGAHPTGVDINMARQSVRSEGEWHRDGEFLESLRGSASYTSYGHDEITAGGTVGTSFDQRTTTLDLVARFAAMGLFTEGAAGLRGQFRDVATGGALRTPSTRDWTIAGFLIGQYDGERAHAEIGLRYDVARYEPKEPGVVVVQGERIPTAPRTFGALSGALGGYWKFAPSIRAGVNVSRSYRAPDFNELYSDGPHLAAYSYDVGNPRLKQETGLGIDGYVRVDRTRLRVEFALFDNAFENYIFPRNTNELGRQGERWKFQFTGRDVRMTGGEAQVSWEPAARWAVEGTLSYVTSRIAGKLDTIPALGGQPETVTSRYLPLQPPLNGRFGLRYEAPRWFAGAASRFSGSQTDLGDFETPTAGYALIEAELGMRLLVGRRFHTITLRVENAADIVYRNHLSRTKDLLPESGRDIALLYRLMF